MNGLAKQCDEEQQILILRKEIFYERFIILGKKTYAAGQSVASSIFLFQLP